MGRKPNLARRHEILEAATRLIHQSGSRGVSMEAVALEVGLRKANLFHYFHTKDELVLAVHDRATEELRARIQATLARPGAADDPLGTVEGIFIAAAQEMKATRCGQGCFVGNLAQEMADHHEPLRKRSAEFFRYWQDQMTVLLLKSRRRGLFRRELDAGLAAEAIVSLFEGAMLQAKTFRNAAIVRNAGRVAAHYLQSFQALQTPERSPKPRKRR